MSTIRERKMERERSDMVVLNGEKSKRRD